MSYAAVFIFLCALNSAGYGNAYYSNDAQKGPLVSVSAGGYELLFSEKTSWTFIQIKYNDRVCMPATGFYQPVLFETGLPGGKADFLGTGHNPEVIDSIELTAVRKGKQLRAEPINDELSIQGADEYIFHKNSRFISAAHGTYYHHEAKITVNSAGINEQYSFKTGDGGMSNVSYMYVFMHIFPNTTKYWITGNDFKETDRGTFLDDNSFSLRKDFRWALIYDPVENTGIAAWYPRIYEGRRGFKNSFWNRNYDNKLYLQIEPKRVKGEEFSYSMSVKAFDASESKWESAGKSIIETALGYKLSNAVPAAETGQYYFSFDNEDGITLDANEFISAVQPFKGKGCLEIKGNGAFKIKKLPIVLTPDQKYRFSAAIRKGAGTSAKSTDCLVNIINYTPAGKLEIFIHLSANAPRDNTWRTYSADFTAGAELTDRLGIVIYNCNSTDSIFVDELKITAY